MTIARTPKERMALIRKTAKKFNKKMKRNKRVLKDETPVFDRSSDNNNINHFIYSFIWRKIKFYKSNTGATIILLFM